MFPDYNLFREKKHQHFKGLLGKIPLALLKQGALSSQKGVTQEKPAGRVETAQTRAGFAGTIKATTDLQGALFCFLCALTIEIRSYRCGPLGSEGSSVMELFTKTRTGFRETNPGCKARSE